MNHTINMIVDILINYFHLLGKICIGTTIGSIIGGKIQLHRLSPYNGTTIVDKNFVLDQVNSLEKETIDYEKKKQLESYILKLSHYVEEEDLKIISNNLRTVNVKRQPLFSFLFIGGMYNRKKNNLWFASKSSFGHEFLQCASSIYDSKSGVLLNGFEQEKGNVYIGRGINGGYTELLASRLYNKKNKAEAYMNMVKLARLIEFFFENPKDMMHLYFSCDLPGLIKHLEQYASNEEIMQLIKDIDFAYVNGRYYSPIALIKSIQIQMKLYNWFQKKCNDKEKLEQFEQLACKNKVVSLLIKGKKLSLKRNDSIKLPQPVKKEQKQNETTNITEKTKVLNVLDVLSQEEKDALEEMIQVENIVSSAKLDTTLQKSILEDVKAMLVKNNNQVDSGKQL